MTVADLRALSDADLIAAMRPFARELRRRRDQLHALATELGMAATTGTEYQPTGPLPGTRLAARLHPVTADAIADQPASVQRRAVTVLERKASA